MKHFNEEAYKNISVEQVNNFKINVYKERPRTLSEMLEKSISKFGNKEAIVYEDIKLSYYEFGLLVRKCAAYLKNCGVSKGDRVSILMHNSIEFPIIYYGIQLLGAIGVVINAKYTAHEVKYILDDSSSKLLITKEDIWKPLQLNKTNLEEIVVLDNNFNNTTSRLDKYEIWNEQDVQILEDDVAVLLYTSGTTGKPKGAMQTQRSIISNAMIAKKVLGLTEKDRALAISPFYHATAVNSQLNAMVYAGGTCVIRPQFKTEEFMKYIDKEKITYAAAVPTMFWFMVNSENFHTYDFSSLRIITYGGSLAPTALIKKLKEKLPHVDLFNCWGLTECTSITTLLPPKDAIRKSDTVGLPVPTLQVAVVDDNGKEVHVGQIGELIIKGPSVVRGYWNKPEATREIFKDGWLYTGDIGKIDEEGYVYVLDRKKDMIIRGGQNIYSIEIENVLLENEKILEVAIVGISDLIYGEQVKAFVVLKEGQKMTESEVINYCSGRIAPYKIPEFVKFVSELPKNATGKVQKHVLLKNHEYPIK